MRIEIDLKLFIIRVYPNMKICCIGNSHVNTFSGESNLTRSFNNSLFSGRNIGPVIAYNFYENHYKRAIEAYSEIEEGKDTYLSLVVGEVDCRLHIPLQADKQKRSDDSVVGECVERLFKCYRDILNTGNKCIVFSTHPTTLESHSMSDKELPIYGCWERRNNICVLWNKYIKEFSEKFSIPYISFYQDLVDNNNRTKMEYYLDYCHLNSNKVMPFIMREINSLFRGEL